MISRDKCQGCYDDFYNNRTNIDGGNRCWSAKTGRMVKRYAIGKWTQPTERFAFREVRLPSCYHQQQTAYYDRLPNFVKLTDVVRARRQPKSTDGLANRTGG